MPENYASFAGGIAEVYAERLAPVLLDPWLNLVLVRARPSPDDQVLDVACGPGRFGLRAAQREPSARYVCLDASASMIRQARIRCADLRSVQSVRARAEQLPLRAAQFDLVTCLFGIMFFRNRAAALAEMRRSLRPGGCLLLTTWADLSPLDFAGSIVAALEAQLPKGTEPLSRLPHSMGGPDLVRRLLVRAGFQRVNVEVLEARAEAPSILEAVTAFTLGTPVVLELMQRGVTDVPAVIRAAAERLESQPRSTQHRRRFRAPSRALLFRAVTRL